MTTTPKKYKPLTAYRITLANGYSYTCNASAYTTLDQARKYFLGQRLELDETKPTQMVISVEKIQ